MGSLNVHLSVSEEEGAANTIGLTAAVRSDLGIEGHRPLTLRLGKFAHSLNLIPHDEPGHQITVHVNTLKGFHHLLPQETTATFSPQDRSLSIGPVVAIFAVKSTGHHGDGRRLFGARHLEMAQLMRHGKDLGLLCYVLTPESLATSFDGKPTMWIQGYAFNSGQWVPGHFPLPDVVYDRIQSRRFERRPKTQAATRLLRALLPDRYFNPGFFDKWTMHQRMAQHPQLKQYLPPTRPLGGPKSLKAFLNDHEKIYLKPAEGSQGKGIIKASRIGNRYQWRVRGRTTRVSRFDAFYEGIARIQRRRRYIMQSDVDLATYGGAPFDVRVLMQKDEDGQWMRTKMYARVAAKGDITSNISRGGSGMSIVPILRRRFGKRRGQITNKLQETAKNIALALEGTVDGPLGELGIDLGVDRRGRIWLIEVNSKPFRKVSSGGTKKTVHLSFHRPMAFARRLATMQR